MFTTPPSDAGPFASDMTDNQERRWLARKHSQLSERPRTKSIMLLPAPVPGQGPAGTVGQGQNLQCLCFKIVDVVAGMIRCNDQDSLGETLARDIGVRRSEVMSCL